MIIIVIVIVTVTGCCLFCFPYLLLAIMLPMKASFDHEKLDVYQESIRFVSWIDELLEKVPKSLAVHNQLDRASTCVPEYCGR